MQNEKKQKLQTVERREGLKDKGYNESQNEEEYGAQAEKLKGARIKSTIIVDGNVWKEIRILAIRLNKEVGELVEEAIRERLSKGGK